MGILCVHDYYKTDLSLSDAGALFYEDVVRRCPNLYMVLCGHRYTMACVPVKFDDDENGITDRTVYQMMCNYQAAGSEGGSGYMRLPAGGRVGRGHSHILLLPAPAGLHLL